MISLGRLLLFQGGPSRSLLAQTLLARLHPRQPPFRSFSSPPPSPPATKSEIDSLKEQIVTLQNLVRQANHQSASAANLARSGSDQSRAIEAKLASIEESVTKIPSLEQAVTTARDRIAHNPAVQKVLEAINAQPAPVRNFLLSKYTAWGLGAACALIWLYRDVWYARTSKEAAEIASLTLRQESLRKTVQETLAALASSPETLETLNALVGKLVQDPQTLKELVKLVELTLATPAVQSSVLDLLAVVFQDPNLQRLAGEFILLGLDIPEVKAMLEQQTADLVSQTVLNETVQRDTGLGVRSALGFAFLPQVLRGGSQLQRQERQQEGPPQSAGEGKEVDKMASDMLTELEATLVPNEPVSEAAAQGRL